MQAGLSSWRTHPGKTRQPRVSSPVDRSTWELIAYAPHTHAYITPGITCELLPGIKSGVSACNSSASGDEHCQIPPCGLADFTTPWSGQFCRQTCRIQRRSGKGRGGWSGVTGHRELCCVTPAERPPFWGCFESAAEQFADFGTDVGVPHERLAHQDGLGAALRQPLDIGAGVDAAFGDQERRLARGWRRARKRAASRSVVARSTLKVFRLRLFTPIKFRSHGQRAIQLGFVMHLDQRRQARSRRQRMETASTARRSGSRRSAGWRPRPTRPPPGSAAHQ